MVLKQAGKRQNIILDVFCLKLFEEIGFIYLIASLDHESYPGKS